MYKKLLFIVLAGSVMITSCVKDEESQSVSDLRAAQAALLNAQAEGQTIENAKLAAELEKILAELKIDLVKAEQSLIKAQIDLQQQQDDAATAASERVVKLMNAYTSAQLDYINAEKTLENLKTDLSTAEKTATEFGETAAEKIIEDQSKIAVYKEAMANYEKYAGMTQEELKSAILTAGLTVDSLAKVKSLADDKVTDATTARDAKLNEVKGYTFSNPSTWLYQNTGKFILSGSVFTDFNVSSLVESDLYNHTYYGYSASYYDSKKVQQSCKVNKYIQGGETETISVEFSPKAGSTVYQLSYKKYSPVSVITETAPDSLAAPAKRHYKETYNTYKKSYTESKAFYETAIPVLKEKVTVYTSQTDPLYKDLEANEKTVSAAEDAYYKAWNAYNNYAQTHNTDKNMLGEKCNTAYNAINTMAQDSSNVVSKISSYETSIFTIEQNIADNVAQNATFKEELEKAEKAVKEAEDSVKAAQYRVETATTDMEAKRTTFNKAVVDYAAGNIGKEEFEDARNNYDLAKTKLGSLQTDLDAKNITLQNAESTRQGWQNNIDANIAENEQYAKDITAYKGYITAGESQLQTITGNLVKARAEYAQLYEKWNALDKELQLTEGSEYKALSNAYTSKKNAYTAATSEGKNIETLISNIENVSGTFYIENHRKLTWSNYEQLLSLIESYETAIKSYSDNLEKLDKDLAKVNAQIDEWIAGIKEIRSTESLYTAALNELNALEKTLCDVTKEKIAADYDYNVVLSAYNLLLDLDNRYTTMQTEIKNLEDDIENWTNQVKTKEDAVTKLQNDIAMQEISVTVYKKVAEDAYVELQAALAE